MSQSRNCPWAEAMWRLDVAIKSNHHNGSGRPRFLLLLRLLQICLQIFRDQRILLILLHDNKVLWSGVLSCYLLYTFRIVVYRLHTIQKFEQFLFHACSLQTATYGAIGQLLRNILIFMSCKCFCRSQPYLLGIIII